MDGICVRLKPVNYILHIRVVQKLKLLSAFVFSCEQPCPFSLIEKFFRVTGFVVFVNLLKSTWLWFHKLKLHIGNGIEHTVKKFLLEGFCLETGVFDIN